MGYTGKIELKEKALKLRKLGKSYSEIQREVDVSKDTLSRWCRDVVLSPQQMEKLRQQKLTGSEKGRLIGAKNQQQKRIDQINLSVVQGAKDIGKMSKRDRFLVGIALCLGEGSKNDEYFGFANSDPNIIKFLMEWVREFGDIPDNKFKAQIWIHDNLDEQKARLFWSNLTGIPLTNFYKSYISKNKPDSPKIRKNKHENGVFAIRICNAQFQRRVLGWMAGILEAQAVK